MPQNLFPGVSVNRVLNGHLQTESPGNCSWGSLTVLEMWVHGGRASALAQRDPALLPVLPSCAALSNGYLIS